MDSIIIQGVAIPRLGFGTLRMPGVDAQPVVESAIALGYRHIDTAAMYQNEAAVGAAIAASGIERSKFFVTTRCGTLEALVALKERGLTSAIVRSISAFPPTGS
ncbi:aldo/keto reductase [Mesorhizobium sp. B292B1B]|uniref:aldo/keto reductase n=1 Tax=unclassified Mesorhizobium TaxID=325217 RepID=UPI001127409D|nr:MULTISPECIES: aldo/keto reductase [unclassified Mesorhizobium]MCA0012133.1 aldo/keto reductase [Mesorhizobium sp. B294B1A1]MCA0038387.1 aldo/keto reductase [Mesorhizobium sp. B292B1B]TPM41211.1 hypothetical protein FJ964_25475 [Mesorhizobium sp. B2-3-2]